MDRREARGKMPISSTGNSGVAAGDQGFTLIEMVVALVIAGMVAALVLPGINRGLDGLRLKSSAARLASALRYARERAISEQRFYRVVIEPAKNRLYIIAEFGQPVRQMELDSRVRISSLVIDGALLDQPGQLEKALEIFFLPNGSASQLEIVLENSRGNKARVINGYLAGSFKVIAGAHGRALLPGTI